MTIARILLAGRRWMRWAPIPASLLLCGGSVTDVGKMLVGALPQWIPFWLAWWLSDGFKTVTVGGDGADHEFKPGVDPSTGQASVVMHDRATGRPPTWLGGGSSPVGRPLSSHLHLSRCSPMERVYR